MQEDKELFNQINSLPDSFLNDLRAEVKEKRDRTNKRKKLFYKIAPALSAACILAVLYMSFFTKEVTFSKVYMAENKIISDIVLPDNTKIALDVNTKITVKYYENEREITLSQGRALFDIAKNKNRPFIIKTARVNIEVLGTKFEVINKKDFFVNVSEGIVRVSNPNKNNKLIALLTKEQSLSLNKYTEIRTLEKMKSENIAKWKRGEIYFDQSSLENIIKEFKKYIDINVKIEDKFIASYPISGHFDAYHFKDFLKILTILHPVKIEERGNKFIITKKI